MHKDLFGGRLNRTAFFIRLFPLLILLVIDCLTLYRTEFVNIFPGQPFLTDTVNFIRFLFLPLGLFFFITLIVRRLHDLGYPGAWSLLLFSLLVFVGIVADLAFYGLTTNQGIVTVLVLVGFLIALLEVISILFLLIKQGQKKANKYGYPN